MLKLALVIAIMGDLLIICKNKCLLLKSKRKINFLICIFTNSLKEGFYRNLKLLQISFINEKKKKSMTKLLRKMYYERLLRAQQEHRRKSKLFVGGECQVY